jgi:hypothetical protein
MYLVKLSDLGQKNAIGESLMILEDCLSQLIRREAHFKFDSFNLVFL